MNTLDFKEGQTYICTKANGSWFTEGKEYKVFLNRYNRPMIIDDENDPCYSHYVDKGDDYQFKLKKEQPKVTLDETHKPVVPKFVAEWFEENKDDLEFPIWELCVDSYGSKDEHGMLNWIQQSENNPIETLIRMKNGYEVEKEPLYRVKIGEGYFVEYQERGALIIPDGNKEIKIFDSKSDAERTAQTIGGSVEEVAEG
ncbi:DUF1642 domain-containing protein [Enterococcus faecium]|uniref:DUF1642 domain-containing protein n=1 Tax=Enterococcus faecium TaxID=1352 RepID=UPI002074A077|nr:DUF1642 domain-containing protein [Enterococcus faecium]MCM6854581.1 DUF1642 domain-containing protein [Enterococcus faecium]MCM6865079.1 DUF1642 domain-containing protein [Enterococcus faecium]MCM6882607.1 DUF1642 domain-containing protein [Enterococcus faecium]MCM6898395.1 DUF1642 domain-containing protein [Enterococcus faecium]MCM6904700.1 DUF1642 domain-containing protein [Enterococcus faecium]